MNLGGGEAVVIKSTVFEENNGALAKSKAIKLSPRNIKNDVKYHFSKHHRGE